MTKAELLEKNTLLENELNKTKDKLEQSKNIILEFYHIINRLLVENEELNKETVELSKASWEEAEHSVKLLEGFMEYVKNQGMEYNIISKQIEQQYQRSSEKACRRKELYLQYQKLSEQLITEAIKVETELKKYKKAPSEKVMRKEYDAILTRNPAMKPATAKEIIGDKIEEATGKRPVPTTLHRQLVTNRK